MIWPPRHIRHALALMPFAVASVSVSPEALADDDGGQNVEALRESLERDRAQVIELIRREPAEESVPLAEDPLLREIAQRMPRTQEALRRSEAAVDDAQ